MSSNFFVADLVIYSKIAKEFMFRLFILFKPHSKINAVAPPFTAVAILVLPSEGATKLGYTIPCLVGPLPEVE